MLPTAHVSGRCPNDLAIFAHFTKPCPRSSASIKCLRFLRGRWLYTTRTRLSFANAKSSSMHSSSECWVCRLCETPARHAHSCTDGRTDARTHVRMTSARTCTHASTRAQAKHARTCTQIASFLEVLPFRKRAAAEPPAVPSIAQPTPSRHDRDAAAESRPLARADDVAPRRITPMCRAGERDAAPDALFAESFLSLSGASKDLSADPFFFLATSRGMPDGEHRGAGRSGG